MGSEVRGRYAPSPTGELHLGNVRTALVAWLGTRAARGTFVMRVEDLDPPRVIPGAEARLLEDLAWLGIDWDEGPYRQSERLHLFEEALARLSPELRAVIQASRPQRVQQDVILASADEEQHYLPLLALQAELARQGLGVSYLGPRMPTHALSTVMRTRRPDRIFLWASLERASNEPIWQTLNILDHRMLLVIGGPGWPDTTPPVSPSVTVVRAHDLASAANLLLHPPESRS